MTVGRDSPAIQLRVPDELKLWLKNQAAQNHRSMNGEVLKRLEESRSRQTEGAKQ